MNIVHVIGNGKLTGAGLQLCYLATELSRTFETEVIAPPDAPLLSALAKEPLLATSLPFSGRAGICFSDIRRFEEYFLRTKPDIVHTHGNLSARIGAALAGVPHLLSTRHGFPEKMARPHPLRAKLYNAVTSFTVTTAYAGGQCLRAEGVPREKIVTIPSGVPRGIRRPEEYRAAVCRTLGFSRDAVVIASFPCEKTKKGESGQRVLLRAFARVAAKDGRVRLLLFDRGGEERELLRLSSLLGVGESVRILPAGTDPTPYREIPALHVDPSEGSESSALTACSLMSLGIPTVAADTAGMRELIFEGENGLFFPSDNSYALAKTLLHALHSPGLLPSLARGAAERYRRDFSLSRMGNAYRDLYRKVVSS